MNENIQEFLYQMVSIFVFLIALSLFLLVYKTSEEMLKNLDQVYASERVVKQANKEVTVLTDKGANLILNIYKGLDTEIVIDGVSIAKNIDRSTFNYESIVADAEYVKELILNNQGEIIQIIYTLR